MKLDTKKWNADRRAIEAEIKEAKGRRGESFRPRWKGGPDDWKLAAAKELATGLYTLRAALRNKNHMVEQTPEQTQKALEMSQYALPAEELAA